MTDSQDDQVARLTSQLEGLEQECQGILAAMRYSKNVRLILLVGLLLFVGVFSYMFYQLYQDITHRRLAEIQAEFTARQDEFVEPLTRELFLLVEDTRPEVTQVLLDRASEDAPKYMSAFDAERTTLVTNLESYLDQKLQTTFEEVVSEHQDVLSKEFPELVDGSKIDQVRKNFENAYKQVGKRYYVDYMREKLEELVTRLDKFPPAEPREPGIPVGEQVASEFLDMVRMMLVYSDRYATELDESEMAAPDQPPSAYTSAESEKSAEQAGSDDQQPPEKQSDETGKKKEGEKKDDGDGN